MPRERRQATAIVGILPAKGKSILRCETGLYRNGPETEPWTRGGRNPSSMKRITWSAERRKLRPQGCDRLTRRNRRNPTRPLIATRGESAVANLRRAPREDGTRPRERSGRTAQRQGSPGYAQPTLNSESARPAAPCATDCSALFAAVLRRGILGHQGDHADLQPWIRVLEVDAN